MVGRHNDQVWIAQQEIIRIKEATIAVDYMPLEGHILEVGAGNGIQAEYFHSLGYKVEAIDVEESIHINNAVFPVQTYNGINLPFPDNSFDVVFSSNVLEHVPWCEELLIEMRRVLRVNGTMIHIVPTPSWRFWTSIAHYYRNIYILRQMRNANYRAKVLKQEVGEGSNNSRRHKSNLWRTALFPFRHGVRGNWITELYYFSRFRWRKTFKSANLVIQNTVSSGVFYTGYGIPGPRTSINLRSKLARILGSSTIIYVLKKAAPFSV